MSETAEVPGFETIDVTAEGAVGELVLNRPEKLNALSGVLLKELIDASAWFTGQGEVKVVVVRGAGRAFSAGADLTAFAGVEGETSETARLEAADLGRRMADALTSTRPLTIARIHGHCVGGGLVVAAACDLRVAASDARFSIPEVDLGIPLAWGGIPRLVREIGPAATKELVLTCREFGPQEAMQLGFLNRVVAPEKLSEEVNGLVSKLAGQPAYSLELTKRQVNQVAEEAGSTESSGVDAASLLGALEDPESLVKMSSYLGGHG
ncbi:MAG: enoyl-CoA hydratase/isomerase family protein [Solirubrobacterales bacterium]|nr:enoyl-CoA hydratase/isomerase family protein [Solirubrobacterales bacterium]HMT05144.1 enoyl-CoA hydratase/isomerase family protein [Solirubrobacterales bacterium]